MFKRRSTVGRHLQIRIRSKRKKMTCLTPIIMIRNLNLTNQITQITKQHLDTRSIGLMAIRLVDRSLILQMGRKSGTNSWDLLNSPYVGNVARLWSEIYIEKITEIWILRVINSYFSILFIFEEVIFRQYCSLIS